MSKWEKVGLGEVVTLLNGRAYKQDELLNEGKTPVLRVGNFFSNKDWYYSDLELDESKYCDKGDLLYAWSASFGPKIWKGPKVIYHYHIWKLELTERINKNYLYYLLEYSTKSIKDQGRGITMLHATKSGMEKMIIPLPPLEVQKQIAQSFDTVSELLALRKKQFEELDGLIKSVFYDMFGDPVTNDKGWEVQQLIELIIEGAGLSYGIVQPGENNSVGIGIIRPVDIIDGIINLDNVKRVPESVENPYKKTRLTDNEILVTVRGTTGDVALSNSSTHGMNVTRGIAVIRQDDRKINKKYLFYYLRSIKAQRYISENTKGATLKQINLSALREMEVLVPGLSLQNQFASIVTKIEGQKALVKQSIQETQTLFDSLMSQYFD